MKKVLIIGHFWPYRNGSVRILGLAKYLPEFAWQPIVLTGPLNKKPPSKFKFVEINYPCFLGSWTKLLGFNHRRDIGDQLKERLDRNKKLSKFRLIFKFFYKKIAEILAYPDEDKNWKKPAIKKAGELIKKEKIDAIISVWPVTSHLIAKEIKDKYKIPWVADFPDPWSQNHAYPYGIIRKIIDRRLEKKTLLTADALITSSRLEKKLEELHKGKKIYSITHGFDPEKVNRPPVELTDKFTITYTGQIYDGKQDPLKTLVSLRDLIIDKNIDPKDVELRFYGPEKNWLEKKIRDYGLSNIVKQYGIVSQEISLKKQRESQILLLLNWEDSRVNYAYFGKTFEYLAAQRPILITGGFGQDLLDTLIKETKAGVNCPKVEEIKNSLKMFYSEYKQKGKIFYYGNWEEIKKYSHLEMAKKFADILNQLT